MLTRLLQITLLAVFCAICAVALADLGRIATLRDQPQTALAFAPLNADARMALIAARMGQGDVEDLAKTGRRLHRADGRFDSVLGMVAHERGDQSAARAHFEAALRKQPTEFQALRHLMVYETRQGRWDDAVGYLQLFGQRWREHWRAHDEVVLAMAADAAGRTALADALTGPPRGLVIDTLLRGGQALIAAELLMAWRDDADLVPAIERVARRLLNDGFVESALLLDRFTLGATRPPAEGFVHNATFAFEPSGSVFDWTIRPQQGVSVEWHTSTDPDQSGKHSFVRLQFRDSPLRLDNLSQVLVLRAGRHRLEVRARADDLRAPTPVSVIVRCDRAPIAELALDPVADPWRDFALDFEVPADCRQQRMFLSNGFMPLTWSARYDGHLDLARIQIVRLP